MALTPEVRSTQGKVLISYEGSLAIRADQAKVLVLFNLPAAQLRATQSSNKVVYSGDLNVKATQARVYVLYSGRSDSPKIKTWGFNLDAHTYYFIRLGSSRKTLVYDKYTNTWSWWCRDGLNSLDVHTGFNWRSAGALSINYGSNVLAGDSNNGQLYIMDPMQGVDDNSFMSYPFERIATGQMVATDRNSIPIYDVDLRCSLGEPALVANTVTLEYSDDQGHSYVVADQSRTIVEGDYGQELSWRSLGQVRSPGRLFRITDNGSFARIDNLSVNE